MAEKTEISDFRIGQTVATGGREGIIVERVGSMVRVKFREGEFGWYPIDEIDGIIIDSILKACPFCASKNISEIKSEKSYNGEKSYQCMKCSGRFSIEGKTKPKMKNKTYCKNCGKKSAVLKSLGVYECESCLDKFKLE